MKVNDVLAGVVLVSTIIMAAITAWAVLSANHLVIG